MAHLLLIDDDPALIPKTGAAGVPRPPAPGRRRPERQRKGSIASVPSRPMSSCSTCACPTCRAWRSIRRSARSTRASPSSSSPWPGRRTRPSRRCSRGPSTTCSSRSTWASCRRWSARRWRSPGGCASRPWWPRPSPTPDVDGAIIGICPAMREVYKAIGRVAGQNVPVLITGESGTGKELVALAIYQHGPRARAPFLTLNCAAIPETLLESELFGHEKGAFTGADRRRIGKFEQCSGGHALPGRDRRHAAGPPGQDPAPAPGPGLRAARGQRDRPDRREADRGHPPRPEGDGRPRGGSGRTCIYRLGVFTIHLPALRERGDDLPLLVRHYLRRFSLELGREVREVAPETHGSPVRLLLAGQHPGAAERPQAGPAPGRRLGPAPGIPARRTVPRHDERQRRKRRARSARGSRSPTWSARRSSSACSRPGATGNGPRTCWGSARAPCCGRSENTGWRIP